MHFTAENIDFYLGKIFTDTIRFYRIIRVNDKNIFLDPRSGYNYGTVDMRYNYNITLVENYSRFDYKNSKNKNQFDLTPNSIFK